MHHPTDRTAHTTVTPVVEHWLEREWQWVHPMKDRYDDPSYYEQMLIATLNKTFASLVVETSKEDLTKCIQSTAPIMQARLNMFLQLRDWHTLITR